MGFYQQIIKKMLNYNSTFGVHSRVNRYMWNQRFRIMLVLGVCVLTLFLFMFSFIFLNGKSSESLSNTNTIAVLSSILFFVLIAGTLTSLLFGYLVCVTHTIANRRLKWLFIVIVFPPVGVPLYLYKNRTTPAEIIDSR